MCGRVADPAVQVFGGSGYIAAECLEGGDRGARRFGLCLGSRIRGAGEIGRAAIHIEGPLRRTVGNSLGPSRLRSRVAMLRPSGVFNVSGGAG